MPPLPYFPLDIDGNGTPETALRIELRNPDISAPAPSACDGNFANGLGNDHACIRAFFNVNYRTCTYSADPAQQAANCNDGSDTFTFSQEFSGIGVTCNVGLNSDNGSNQNLPIRADLAIINESTGPYAGYSRITLLDAELVTNSALERSDVSVSCNNEGVLDAAVATISCGAIGCLFGCSPCSVQALITQTMNDFAAEDGDTAGDDIDDLLDDVLDDLLQDYSQGATGTTLVDNGQVCYLASSSASCPAGTTFVASRQTCTINSAPGASAAVKRCVSPLLGFEGRVNIGSLLASISPGLSAVVDFMFVAGGDGVTAGAGHNINLFGGMENLSHDNCVPQLVAGDPGFVENPNVSGLPQVSLFQNSVRPGTGTPFHVGAAVSEEFVNYALFKMWDSGLLCLTVTSAIDGALSPDAIGALLFGPSLPRFLFPLGSSSSYLALGIRPQQPPSVAIENIADASEEGDEVMLITITLPRLEIDFMFWTQDRYTRISTVQTDLQVGLTLDIVPGANGDELKLALGEIDFQNGAWLNSSTLLSESELSRNPGDTLGGVAGPIAAGLASAIPNIALEELINSALAGGVGGLQLPIRIDFSGDSFMPFEEAGGHPFLGVFFNLVTAQGGGLTQRPETTVEVTSVTIPEDHTAFAAATLGEGPLPRIEIAMDATGPEGAEYEFSYRTSLSGWSEWSRSKYAVIEHRGLVMQQRQRVYARARIVGAEMGTDFSSAQADYVIDVTPPEMQVTATSNGNVELQAYDLVYHDDLEYRVNGGAWTSVGNGTVDLGNIGADANVEVRDPSGNVNGNQKLRGRGDPDAAVGGCGCATAGDTSGSSVPAAMLSLAMLGLVIARRRRR
jgi:MYXO-CTERM domain-containing protein